ncbi:MAG: hypothetical protein ACKPKO_37960, partial [Candidatus Fonsibacter sp.]
MGHTATPFIEDDRFSISIADLSDEVFPNIVHNAYISNLESIILNGLIPGGGRITQAMRSQLSAFHMMVDRLQESSRARTADAIIFFNVARTKPILNATIRGVPATRKAIPGQFIDQIWIRFNVPLVNRFGKIAMVRRWVTLADYRASKLKITGSVGV